MKILQVGDNDLYCRKFAGHDLHLYLNEIGQNSSHLVWEKLSKDSKTKVIADRREDREEIYNATKIIRSKYGLDSIQNPIVFDILYDPLFLRTDIVHYHLIHNHIFDISFFPLMSKLKPTVWSLHDPWALYGHCIYNYDCQEWKDGCGNCPRLKTPFQIIYDNSALNFEIKRTIFEQIKIDIIVASKWMKNKIEQSTFFDNSRIHVINYGIDQNLFKPFNKQHAKKKLGIPLDAVAIAFRCTYSEFKGLDYIKYTLKKIRSSQKIILLLLDGEFTDFNPNFQYIKYGWVKDDNLLSNIYQATDLFLMPSTAEAFGMMAIEAMSCGTLPIVLEGTSLPEIVNSPDCGVATKIDKEKYFKSVQYFIDNKMDRDKRAAKCVEYAKKHYSKEMYRENIMKVYIKAKNKFQIDQKSKHILNEIDKHQKSYIKNLNNKNQIITSFSKYKKVIDENRIAYNNLLSDYNLKSKDLERVMNRKIIRFTDFLKKLFQII